MSQTEKGARVANGRDFREMTSAIPAAQLPGELQTQAKRATTGPVRELDLGEFKQLVRQRAAEASQRAAGASQ